MKLSKLTFTACLLCIATTSQAGVVSSTFDVNGEGWTVIGDAAGPVNYSATGGNPGGMVFFNDSVVGGVVYFNAPAKFLGNQLDAFGEQLQFDLRQTGTGSQFNSRDVILIGNSTELNLFSLSNPLPVGDWVSYSVTLDDSEAWEIAGGGGPATNAQIQSVLSNLTDLRIRGEFIVGSDIGRLDNVILNSSDSAVPEPSSIFLAGIAMASLRIIPGARRRKSLINKELADEHQ